MIFKKTVLALSLSAVSAFAAAAPDAPAPAAATAPNLLQGVPAYVLTAGGPGWGFTAYSPLMDDDRIHVGGVGQGAWTGFTTEPTMYAIDFDGSPCMDKFGSCAGKPGKGAADVNTVVVYFEQAPGTEQEPTDATLAGGKTNYVSLYGYTGKSAGISEAVIDEGTEEARKSEKRINPFWPSLGKVSDNTLAKHTFTFPTAKYSKLQIIVKNSGYATHHPRLVHVEAFNRPVAPTQP